MIRTRFAPSPTGSMHIGNLRTALYEYLIAKSQKGSFILRIEDTDQERYVEGAVDIIYRTLETAGITYDEGPDIGGAYGPYVQSQRKSNYLEYAKKLVKEKKAYYCFCTKERLASLHAPGEIAKYDRCCLSLSESEVEEKLASGCEYVIRQLIPEGKTSFKDEVYGEITVDNSELEDQILIKSDMMPTYNFANVVDDHEMKITHVVRGCEYLSSTPKYNLLYSAFGWEVPIYVHLPQVLNESGEKLSKRRGDASFDELINMGFLPQAIVNYIALLGWSPSDNKEIFSLSELTEAFSIQGISKSPSTFDMKKLSWFNGEYFKLMKDEDFFILAEPYINETVKTECTDKSCLSSMCRTRVQFAHDIKDMLDFIDKCPEYSIDLYTHKKMKTNPEIALAALKIIRDNWNRFTAWDNDSLYSVLTELAKDNSMKNSQLLWPLRTALSGKPATPCGASELMALLGKEESKVRIDAAIELLQ